MDAAGTESDYTYDAVGPKTIKKLKGKTKKDTYDAAMSAWMKLLALKNWETENAAASKQIDTDYKAEDGKLKIKFDDATKAVGAATKVETPL
jgi:hypothetical protein